MRHKASTDFKGFLKLSELVTSAYIFMLCIHICAPMSKYNR